MAQPGPEVPYPSQCGRKRPGKTLDPVSLLNRERSFLEMGYTETALVFKGVLSPSSMGLSLRRGSERK